MHSLVMCQHTADMHWTDANLHLFVDITEVMICTYAMNAVVSYNFR